MKHLKRFNESVDDIYDDNICARSETWALYRFKSLDEYIDFESSISPDIELTNSPFSTFRYSDDSAIDSIFKSYQLKHGDFFILINRDYTPQDGYIFQFNCNGDKVYGVYDSRNIQYDPKYIRHIINDVDYTDSNTEKMIKNCLDFYPNRSK